MEHVNPYDPPGAPVDQSGANPLDADGTISARFLLTTDYLIDTLARYRLQHSRRCVWRWCRFFAAFIFIFTAAGSLLVLNYSLSTCALFVFMIALAIFIFFEEQFSDYFTLRSFRNSPHCNRQQIVRLSNGGYQGETETEQTDFEWTAFSKAVIFDDGILLFQGPKLIFIADATLDDYEDSPAIRPLVTEKVPTNNRFHRSRGRRGLSS